MTDVLLPVEQAGSLGLLPVVTWVPAELATEAQADFARIAASRSATLGDPASTPTDDGYYPPFDGRYGPSDPWHLPDWDDFDQARAAATWILADLAERQRRVLAPVILLDRQFTTRSLVRWAGYDDDTHPSPVFRALGNRFRKVGRRPVWGGGVSTEDGQLFSVDLKSARGKIFSEVLLADWPELAAELREGHGPT